jgi:rubrerythrin
MSNAELESLKLAIKTEEDGRSMYLKAADKVSNPLAKSVMTQLAKEELLHIEVIKKFYESIKQGSKAEIDDFYKKAMTYDLRRKTVFEAAKSRMEKTVEADPDSQHAYKAALKFEEDGANMYKKLAGESNDPVAKKLFDFMFIQESDHFRFLQEGLNYLENPQQWFIEMEKPNFEG